MLRRFCLLILLLPLSLMGSEPISKILVAVRTPLPPLIDGRADDQVWALATPVSDFHQYEPYFAAPAGQASEVRILYDDHAIYIGARLFDSAPDSILTQLGNRDDGLNADFFGIQFDSYLNGLDAYIFEVYASGVQRDRRRSDPTFNAVWESAVTIDPYGWTVEMRIPWSAIRFPVNQAQVWGLQLHRSVRRTRELIQWALVPKGVTNTSGYWGQLHGLSNINPPLRLSFTPFISAHVEHYPYNTPGSKNFSEGLSGGMDLKYGISKSFTLDMTLMPDFSTVASDHEIKNLTAFETVYDEKRGFFKEGVDLFTKGDIFYSRRIGRKPQRFNQVKNDTSAGETLTRNPDKAQLINATKVSGRTSSNLGIGVFNAVTANTYALAEDSAGNRRRILTEPFTNYNIAVIDQGLNLNSSVYLINTNVTRSQEFNNENVTAAGITYFERSNQYRLTVAGRISQIFFKDQPGEDKAKPTDRGYRYNMELAKVKGNFQFRLLFDAMDSRYNINGLGLNHRNDQISNGATVTYAIYEPFWKMLSLSSSLVLNNSSRMSTGKNTGRTLQWRTHGLFSNYLWTWMTIAQNLNRSYDYYEPRSAGRFYRTPLFTNFDFNFSSDYRKPFALDGEIEFTVNEENYSEVEFTINPIMRFSDRLTVQYRLEHSLETNDRGFVEKISDKIIFGNRELRSIENSISGRYIFRNNLSLSLWARQYWFRGKYSSYFTLREDGSLEPNPEYAKMNDFNFNSFNLDLFFDWEFSPGSNFSVIFKNAILREDDQIIKNFFDNFQNTLESPQLNSLTVRFLYYLDYQSLLKRKRQEG